MIKVEVKSSTGHAELDDTEQVFIFGLECEAKAFEEGIAYASARLDGWVDGSVETRRVKA